MNVKIFLMVVVLTLAASLVNAAIISNSLVVDDIEYYIQANDSVYDLGEDVEMLFRVTNLGEAAISISTMYPIRDFTVSEKVGEDYNEIWNWSWDKSFPMGTTTFSLQPNESKEINGTWPQIDLNNSIDVADHTQVLQGIYSLSGYLAPTDTSIAIDVTIVPEPATILLVGTGLLYLRRNKRTSLRK